MPLQTVSSCADWIFSPVKGPEGNIEYLMFVQKSEQPGVLDDSVAEQVVAASHSSLDK